MHLLCKYASHETISYFILSPLAYSSCLANKLLHNACRIVSPDAFSSDRLRGRIRQWTLIHLAQIFKNTHTHTQTQNDVEFLNGDTQNGFGSRRLSAYTVSKVLNWKAFWIEEKNASPSVRGEIFFPIVSVLNASCRPSTCTYERGDVFFSRHVVHRLTRQKK